LDSLETLSIVTEKCLLIMQCKTAGANWKINKTKRAT